MENSTGNRRALKAIIIEVIIIVIIVVAFLFVFKLISFPGTSSQLSSKSTLPISANSPGVKTALITYALVGSVKTITLGSDGKYKLILHEFPSQTFTLAKGAAVKNPQTLKALKVQDLKPGSAVRIGLSYDSKTNNWFEIPEASKITTIRFNN